MTAAVLLERGTGARATGGPGSVPAELEDQSGKRIPVSLVAEGAETASS